ncbi:MAG: pyrroline-5-carboxylate reductase [Clostridia bacterium]|nr:pyrroline-5-carboxylate reductase [Clostridia bacterium]
MRNTLAIIGAGNMGGAIAEGILSAGVLKPSQLIMCDRDKEKLSAFEARGCTVTEDPVCAASEGDAWLLAVKPQIIGDVMETLAHKSSCKLVISIAAGVKIEGIAASLSGASIVRVMPNTPLMVGCGVSAVCFGDGVSEEDKSFAKSIFSAAGSVFETAEENMNSATALTSSAVAYFARIIGVMADWAKENGFDYMSDKELYSLVCRTAVGTAGIIEEKDMDPSALVRAVTSPKGTTEKALEAFDRMGLDEAFRAAMTACRKRAEELSGN